VTQIHGNIVKYRFFTVFHYKFICKSSYLIHFRGDEIKDQFSEIMASEGSIATEEKEEEIFSSSPSRGRGRSVRVRIPSAKRKANDDFPARKSRKKASVLAKHGDEIVKMVNKRVAPPVIAHQLRTLYGYGDDEVNTKTVSDRISYMKKNNLASFAPTNDPLRLTANSRLSNCIFFIFNF
jgi:hypothetical protein